MDKRKKVLERYKKLATKIGESNGEYRAAKAQCMMDAMIRQITGERMEPGTPLWEEVGEREKAAKKALAEDTLSHLPEVQSLLTEMNLIDFQGTERDDLAGLLDTMSIAKDTLNSINAS